MSKNLQNEYLSTRGYILRRTNYGEADRILNIITPQGKISAIAKGVRKDKSKLAGGIEMFSLTELNIRLGKNQLGVVTGAKMIKFYHNLLKDFTNMELAASILKKVSNLAESSDNPEYFEIVDQSLAGLDMGIESNLVEAWALINLLKASGEEINLYRDATGEKLSPEKNYHYDVTERAMVETLNGDLGEKEIKLLRLMSSTKLEVVARVKDVSQILPKISRLARIVSGDV